MYSSEKDKNQITALKDTDKSNQIILITKYWILAI
jgi:hypothetical protein